MILDASLTLQTTSTKLIDKHKHKQQYIVDRKELPERNVTTIAAASINRAQKCDKETD